MAPKRGRGTAVTKDDFLRSVRIETVSDPAARRPTARDYFRGKTGSEIEGLNDRVWDSYQTGEFMIVGCPPDLADYVLNEILKAKNYLNHIHREEVGPTGMKGVDLKRKMRVVNLEDPADPNYVADPDERAEYAEKAKPFGCAVVFQAHPPKPIGRLAMDPEARRKAEEKTTAANRARAARLRAESNGTKPKASGARPDPSEVREWAKSQGIEVSDRGRVPAELVVKFQAAEDATAQG